MAVAVAVVEEEVVVAVVMAVLMAPASRRASQRFHGKLVTADCVKALREVVVFLDTSPETQTPCADTYRDIQRSRWEIQLDKPLSAGGVGGRPNGRYDPAPTYPATP